MKNLLKNRKLINFFLITALLLLIVFNIILLSTNLYKGKYVAKTENGKIEIIFDTHTYAYKEYDNDNKLTAYFTNFYEYYKKSEYKKYSSTTINLEFDAVVLERESGWYYDVIFKRNSVFSITAKASLDDKENGLKYLCTSAIWLQVFYVLGEVILICTLLIYNKKIKDKDSVSLKQTNKSDTQSNKLTTNAISQYIDNSKNKCPFCDCEINDSDVECSHCGFNLAEWRENFK